jgi:hypothetical protein
MNSQFTRFACAALFTIAAVPAAVAQDDKSKAAEVTPGDDIHAIRGNPPADSSFGKLKLGMKPDEVIAVVGKPDSERSYCTGKHRIPFYLGRDRAYAEYYYKGQGKLYFYSEFSEFKMFRGAVHTCSPTKPFELAGVEYNVNESGIAPKEGGDAKKDGEEAKKEPAEAAK